MEFWWGGGGASPLGPHWMKPWLHVLTTSLARLIIIVSYHGQAKIAAETQIIFINFSSGSVWTNGPLIVYIVN